MEAQDKKERDQYIVQDYQAGQDLKTLSRSYGVTERRISQVLKEQGVAVKRRHREFEREPISSQHERIGRHLVDFRFEKDIDRREAANQLGWGYHKLRKVEEGVAELELLDLLDISTYTETPINEVLNFG